MRQTLHRILAGHDPYPGVAFRGSSEIDEHHGFRIAWELVASDGSVATAGLDVGELAESGQFAQITGFFGDLPTKNAA